MTFISEALYKSLKKEQASLLDNIAKLQETEVELKARINIEEAFLASFDTEQSKLQATIDNAISQINPIERKLDEAAKNQEELEEKLKEKIDDVEKAEVALKEAQDEKEPDQVEINKISAQVNTLRIQKNDLEAALDANQNQIDTLESQLKTNHEIASQTEAQLEENESRKSSLEEEELANFKDHLSAVEKELVDTSLEYKTFLERNLQTINNFELQDSKRNSIIKPVSSRELFNRPLPTEEGDALINESNVLTEVVSNDLGVKNLSETEQELLDAAIEQGQNKEFDRNYLSAQEASSMSRAFNFSLIPVSLKIKEAAMNGLYSIVVRDLNDSSLYALDKAGYTVTLTSSRFPEFEIRWDQITQEGSSPVEEKEKEKLQEQA